MSKVVLTIKGDGGEFTYGFITDPDEIEFVKARCEYDDVALEMEGDDDIQVAYFDHDQVVHVYGPSIDNAVCRVEVTDDDNRHDVEDEVVAEAGLDDVGLASFSYSNPVAYEHPDAEEGCLEFGGYRTEKRVEAPFVLPISSSADFDPACVFVGVTLLDEILCSEEIVATVLYATADEQKALLQEYRGDDYDADEPFQDALMELFGEMNLDPDSVSAKAKSLLEKMECEMLEVEGKGETEETFVVVKDYDSRDDLFAGEIA